MYSGLESRVLEMIFLGQGVASTRRVSCRRLEGGLLPQELIGLFEFWERYKYKIGQRKHVVYVRFGERHLIMPKTY
jgi:hypothetical protein